MVTNFEGVVAGAVTGGFFALTTGLGVTAMQPRAGRRGQRDWRTVYSQLLAATGVTLLTAHALRAAVEFRSGLKEGVDVAMHHRKPLDPLELDAHLRRDTEPIYQAWSGVWVAGARRRSDSPTTS